MVSGFGQVKGDFSLTKQSKVSALGKVVATSAKFGGIIDRLAPFSPLSLNPRLAYEAESSMVAPFERPTLDLDPSNPSSLDIITATRAGVATYTDADGVIQIADPNTVRVDHVDGVPMILVEPAATNLVNDSTSFTTGLDITQETGIDAPDGTNTATRLTGIQAAPGERSLAGASSVTPSAEITGSVYLRGTAGEVISTYTKRQGAGAFVASSRIDVTLTGDWQRLDGMTLTLNADNNQASIAIVNSLEATADVVDVWGAQIEEGAVATSFIPTSGSAVTRNADNLVIDGTDFSDFYNATEGTFYVEGVMNKGFDGGQNYVLGSQSSSTRFLYQASSSNSFRVYDGATTSTVSYGSPDQIFRAAVTYDATNKSLSVNGAISDSSHNGNLGSIPTALYIGSTNFIAHANTSLKRIIYWPTHSSRM